MYIFVILYRRELDIAGYTGNQGQMVTPEECKKVFIEMTSEKLLPIHTTVTAPPEYLRPVGGDLQRNRWLS